MANNKLQTTTQIRNLYSVGICYLNISFYNNNISFKFSPFSNTDNMGVAHYDKQKTQTTTLNYEDAYALYNALNEILDDKVNSLDLLIQLNGATIDLKYDKNTNETVMSINKNGIMIPFKFPTIVEQIKDKNNQPSQKVIQTGVGVLKMILEGYLTGINADRHLNKLTEDYIESKSNNPQTNKNNYNYKQNNNYKKPYNNYNNQNNQGQNMSSYQIPN